MRCNMGHRAADKQSHSEVVRACQQLWQHTVHGVQMSIGADRDAHRVKPFGLKQALELRHILGDTQRDQPTRPFEKLTQHEQTHAVLSARLGHEQQTQSIALGGRFMQKLGTEIMQQLLQVLLVGMTVGMMRNVVPVLAESEFCVPCG